MPEWPEMEHYRRLLADAVRGRRVTGTTVNREKSVNVPIAEFDRRVTGRQVTDVERVAKMLVFRLEGGDSLLLHLMLGGAVCYGTAAEQPNRTVQVDLAFGEHHLFFIGLRLGYLHLCRPDDLTERFRALGPDPFDPALTPEALADRFRGKRRSLKVLLADQTVLSGIGNCYSDEICFATGIHPARKADSLAAGDVARLHRAMRSVLLEALERGGYMEIPFRPGDTVTGGSIPHLRVYDREGEPCRRCGGPVVRTAISGKKSFVCPHCQA